MLRHASNNTVQQSRDKSNTMDIKKLIVNLSDRNPNAHEISLLQKGPNFNLNRLQLSPFKIIRAIEPALDVLPSETANEFRNKIMVMLSHQKPYNSNLSKNELYALKQLRNDKTIIITRADIMNNSDYERVREHPQEDPCELIKETKSRAALNKLKAETKSCNPCRFYELPNIHKNNTPQRPVVDFTNTPTYNLANYLARILKPYDKLINHGIKNSIKFRNNIDNIHIEEDEMIASFDEFSLFTNVPINRALDIIYGCLESDSDLNLRYPLIHPNLLSAWNCGYDPRYSYFKENFTYRKV
ncbi:unnamed protein product [Schistosoma mattheei]|uniref:Uncharacterized protein n=1 Tax=Schistosoma mattheei TaxID=31246 RepID=A0A183NW55_9TREM|nr:unnamed protein product [Schistosoma mattheei]